jgi:hypothetical protein
MIRPVSKRGFIFGLMDKFLQVPSTFNNWNGDDSPNNNKYLIAVRNEGVKQAAFSAMFFGEPGFWDPQSSGPLKCEFYGLIPAGASMAGNSEYATPDNFPNGAGSFDFYSFDGTIPDPTLAEAGAPDYIDAIRDEFFSLVGDNNEWSKTRATMFNTGRDLKGHRAGELLSGHIIISDFGPDGNPAHTVWWGYPMMGMNKLFSAFNPATGFYEYYLPFVGGANGTYGYPRTNVYMMAAGWIESHVIATLIASGTPATILRRTYKAPIIDGSKSTLVSTFPAPAGTFMMMKIQCEQPVAIMGINSQQVTTKNIQRAMWAIPWNGGKKRLYGIATPNKDYDYQYIGAIINHNPTSQVVTVKEYDPAGALLLTTTITVPGNGQELYWVNPTAAHLAGNPIGRVIEFIGNNISGVLDIIKFDIVSGNMSWSGCEALVGFDDSDSLTQLSIPYFAFPQWSGNGKMVSLNARSTLIMANLSPQVGVGSTHIRARFYLPGTNIPFYTWDDWFVPFSIKKLDTTTLLAIVPQVFSGYDTFHVVVDAIETEQANPIRIAATVYHEMNGPLGGLPLGNDNLVLINGIPTQK